MTVHVVGNATLDLTYRVARFPAPGETCLCTARHNGPGGKGLNQAVASARAGASVVLHAPLGKDAAADQLRAILKGEQGLRLNAWVRADLPSDESSIWVSESGENVIVSTADCARSVCPDEVEMALQQTVAGDILAMQGNLTEQTTHAALAAGKSAKLTTVLNPAPVGYALQPLSGLVDVLVVNRVEAEAFGLDVAPGPLSEFARRLGGAVVVTLGAESVVFALPDGTVGEQPVEAVEPVDTTGAGDAFVGTLCAALEYGVPLRRAIAQATFAGREAVLNLGALTPASRP